LLERGKDASSRRFDLAPLLREGRVIEEATEPKVEVLLA
jgi:hypothetical protein